MAFSPSSRRLVVLYDGECRLCSGTAARLRRLDRHGRLDLIDLHRADIPTRFPHLDRRRAMQAIQAVDAGGRSFSGVDAFARIGARLPGWRWVAWLLRVPVVHGIAAIMYRWVARNRSRWNRDACPEGTCRIR